MTEDERKAVAARGAGQKVRFRALSADEQSETVFDVQIAGEQFCLMADRRYIGAFDRFDDLWRAAVAICPQVAVTGHQDAA